MLEQGDKLKIIGFNCGRCAEQQFCRMGILCGKIVEIQSMQPFKGPITLKIGNTTVTLGRGLWEKVEYETLDKM